MKALSKPISSPGRADNFPPPLMRFLRSKSCRKGKSRSSPIFYIRCKRNSGRAVIETIQEPSSPKVTCIGQVRASRSAGKSGAAAASRRLRRPCWLLKKTKTLLSPKISSTFQKSVFSRWGLFLRSGYCKKGAETEDPCRVCSTDQKSEKAENILDGHNDKNALDGYFPSPRNAVILTRCRSVPYKSSSLGGLFWGSSLFEGGENGTQNDAESRKRSWENPRSEEEKLESLLVNSFEELKGNAVGAVHPLLLTRCKSEPAARRLGAV